MLIKIKKVYEKPDRTDGFRILVDRFWPHNITKLKNEVTFWIKDIAPTNELSRWFSYDPSKWDEFKKRYYKELECKQHLVDFIISKEKMGLVTLLYSAKNDNFNNAIALLEYIQNKAHH